MRLAAIGLLGFIVLLAATQASGAPPANAELAKRLRALELRAQEYDRAVRGVIYTCPRCKGAGQTMAGRCASCSGSGLIASKKLFDKLALGMRSPAYRARSGGAAASARMYADMLRTQRLPFEYGVIVRTELWDERHGVVTLQRSRSGESGGGEQGLVRWVLAPEGGVERWFLWDEAADGAFPAAPIPMEVAEPSKPSSQPAPTPLPQLEAAIAAARLRHAVASTYRLDLTVVVELSRAPSAPAGELQEAREADLESLVRVIQADPGRLPPTWMRLRVRFLARYKSTFGLIEHLPFASAEILRSNLERVTLPGLSRRELWGLFAHREEEQEGYRRLPDLDPTDVETSDLGLPKVAAQALDGALAAADMAHARYRFALDAGTFVVALADPEEGSGEAGQHRDARRVLAAVREVVGGLQDWRTLRILYLERYKHRLGRIEERPSLLAEIDREVVDRLVVENLDAEEVWSLFAASRPQHDGWKRVDGP